MLPGQDRTRVGRLTFAAAVWFLCIPAALLPRANASPAESAQRGVQDARRRHAPMKVVTAGGRHISARSDGASRRTLAKAKNVARPTKAPAPKGAYVSDENGRRRSVPSTDGSAPKEMTPSEVEQEVQGKVQARPSDQDLEKIARIYCSNNIASAAEARVAWQNSRLVELETEVTKKSEALAVLIQESRAWVEKREKLLRSARDNLVEVYAKMRPEVAAQQLAAMSEESATSIIARLNARSASAILNEMGSERAARLADGALKGVKERPAQDKSGS